MEAPIGAFAGIVACIVAYLAATRTDRPVDGDADRRASRGGFEHIRVDPSRRLSPSTLPCCGARCKVRAMRGYFGIGVEGISKPMNLGSLWRTAHAFGASFIFTIGAKYSRRKGERSDTSKTSSQVPLHEYADVAAFHLPKGCTLVGIEILDEAIELPSFPHPRQAAYVLGPERGHLSSELLARCAHVVKIPTKFSLNLGLAGAIVMYD